MYFWGTWLAQSVEHAALDLEVMSSSPMLGIELILKKEIHMCVCISSRRTEKTTRRKVWDVRNMANIEINKIYG